MFDHKVRFYLCSLLFCCGSVLAGEVSDETRKMIEADWARQEQVTRNLKCDTPQALDGAIARGRLMIADMREVGAEKEADKAEKVFREVKAARNAEGDNGVAYERLYYRLRWALRQLALSNPKIDFDEIVFIKRQWPSVSHQCSHRVGEAQIPGANLCVLKGLSPDGKMRYILDEEHSKGGIGRFDVSYDGKRIVFPYAAPRPVPTPYGYGKPGVRGGACIMYDIYEVNVDGAGFRQLTNDPDAEDTEPIYLPQGRIAFMTSRDDRYVQCGDWALACGMYTMDASGGDLRRVTEPKEGEFYPNMLEDGRIMYTRWDYVMKGYNVIQQLWTVNPDGRRASLLYGDHYAFSIGPITFFEPRQIPGTSKIICTGAAHHNTGVGPIMIVDFEHNRGTRKSMVNVTPEVGYPEINSAVFREVVQDELPGRAMSAHDNATGWYSSPYPISEKQYMVASSHKSQGAARNGYGIYLMDIHHNKELIYRFDDASCYSPMPLRSRKEPRIIPDMVKGIDPDTPATVIVTDIYQGLEGVKRGEVKYLRVLETHSKTVRTTPQRCDIGVNSGWDIRGVLGIVPVEEDGSVNFYLPPHKQIFFEALDKNYLEIRRMRNFMNAMPGETVSCTGCHEPYGTVATNNSVPKAVLREPSQITPPPWGTDGFSFRKIVQPILNKNCIMCHDGSGNKDKAFDLRGLELLAAPAGYDRDHAPHRQHEISDSFYNLLKYISYIRVGGYQGEKLPLAANATGSRHSKLMKMLKEGHNDVKLDTDQWRALAAWIDCNGPYYGSWSEITITPEKAGLLATPSAASGKQVKERMGKINSRDESSKLRAYINCGCQSKSSGEGPEKITQRNGKGWLFCDFKTIAGLTPFDAEIAFDDSEIVFSLADLQEGANYKIGLTWWDYNGVNRRQSIWACLPDGSGMRRIYDATNLPSYKQKQMPEQILMEVPLELIKQGKSRIVIRQEGAHNAVISEIWLEAVK